MTKWIGLVHRCLFRAQGYAEWLQEEKEHSSSKEQTKSPSGMTLWVPFLMQTKQTKAAEGRPKLVSTEAIVQRQPLVHLIDNLVERKQCQKEKGESASERDNSNECSEWNQSQYLRPAS